MLLGSSTSLLNSAMSHLFSILYTGSQLKKRIDFKLASLCFKSLNGSAPTYLSDLHLYTPSRQIRSTTDTQVFRIPSFHTKSSGSHSLYQAPTTWNQLPVSIRHASSDSSFKSSLKTFLFSQTLSLVPLPWDACVCQGVCLCACVCGFVCVCARTLCARVHVRAVAHVFAVCVFEL